MKARQPDPLDPDNPWRKCDNEQCECHGLDQLPPIEPGDVE